MSKSVLKSYNDANLERELVAIGSAIESLLSAPAKVDFYSVARASGVSRSTLYRNPRLREMVESARASQPDPWKLVRILQDENADLHARLALVTEPLVRKSSDKYAYSLVRLSPVA